MTTAILPAPFRLIRLDDVGSTNDEARRLVQEGEAAADLLVVSALTQRSGRGRRGRVWDSPAGNLHASLLIRRDQDLGQSAQMGFVAAVALAEALAELVPHAQIRCKWPNDVLADGGKICGMLLEAAEDGWLILGLGVNVVRAPPPGVALYPATALADLGCRGEADDVLAAFCGRFGPWLALWRAEGLAPVRTRWLELARGLGEAVVIRLEAETLTGRFAGLDEDGALILDQGDGNSRRIMAGDVFFPG